MGCCGKKREALRTEEVAHVERRVAPLHAPPQLPVVSVQEPGSEQHFHNSGSANLSIRGPITGRIYLFAADGEPVAVDARDTPYLGGISRILPGPRVRPRDKSKKE